MYGLFWAFCSAFMHLEDFLTRGTRRAGGFRRHSASTTTKGRGMRTPETATTAVCSFSYPHGAASAVGHVPIWPNRASSYTARGSFTGVTATPGASGAPQGSAGSGE